MLRTNENIIKRPIFMTDKATRLSEGENKVIFEVSRTANKIEIKNAVQALFNVTVTDVNTALVRGKDKRMGRGYAKLRNWKKAIVSLKKGDEIKFFDDKAE
ncbi:MAG: 50S ribosomal protein L23 [Polyangiaceae bacterium]|nr:50S ribosomal protein L23 [Polyangiaceae bacterium]